MSPSCYYQVLTSAPPSGAAQNMLGQQESGSYTSCTLMNWSVNTVSSFAVGVRAGPGTYNAGAGRGGRGNTGFWREPGGQSAINWS